MCGSVAHDGDGDVEEDKKVLCQVLGWLHLPETVDDDKIQTLKFWYTMSLWYLFFLSCASPPDRTPCTALTDPRCLCPQRPLQIRRSKTISKKYADKLAGFSEEEYRRLEQLDALFRFLDDIVPLDDGEEVEPMRTRGRKRWVFRSIVLLA
jgi:condensin complex subunit 3